MLYRAIRFCFLFAALAGAAVVSSAAPSSEDVPAWLRQAAQAAAPVYDKKVSAVVLHNEKNVTVTEDGRVVTTTNYAVRILLREGRSHAYAHESYLTDTGKVRELRAWMIRPSGEVKKYGKDETMDISLADNDVYNESRVKVISAENDVEGPGTVFGYQSVSEERTVFTQDVWNFQRRLPTLASRYTLTLPAGWRASGVMFNSAKLDPTVTGSTYSWELKSLPFIEDEPNSPSVATLSPRLAVSFFPADGAKGAMGPGFNSWLEVSRWLSGLHDPQAEPDDALAAKARELTANSKTELEKIQAIGRYVQNIQYISIQIGLNRGGGMRPHTAAEVFAKSYGDCKDKANLMRAMLRAVKITAYPVGIYSGDRTYVREEWPSPQQFNHCIVAVKVGDETKAASIITHPTLGRLLIFDATDDNTPVGDLPEDEQGSFALIMAGADGALLRMPVTPPESNRRERTTDVNLSADGSITAIVHSRDEGQAAARARGIFKSRSRPEYFKIIEGWIARGSATGARLSKVEPVDSHAEGRFALDVEFAADRYAQTMQNRLLVFKPSIVSQGRLVSLVEPTRKHPVVLESESFTEIVRFKLPDGFEIDEMPEPTKLDSAFGTYTAGYEMKDGQLVFKRTLVQRAATIPAEQYAAVRNFFGRIRATEEEPVVLARK
ncbi:MAG TPA: DUF3857 domain-containing transglutaminase family protein [Pyrinomonadaceae bacterium]|jgi:hypothetical protein|nr:DUF3857 domain-containing transglutaminase family protein [Pyrinomonadaceae bacterium]